MSGSGLSVKTVWLVTILVALGIVGVSVMVSLKNRAGTQVAEDVTPPAPPAMSSQLMPPPSQEEPEPEPDISFEDIVGDQASVELEPEPAEPEPEAVPYDETPELLLNNLAGTLKITSPAPRMRLEQKIPLEHTCYRNNVSPPFDWTGAPAETQSYVMFFEKREDGQEPFVNWMLFNIGGDTTSLPYGVSKDAETPEGYRHATSDHNNIGYIGPCERQGQFNYAFRLFALDTTLEDVPANVGKYDLIRAMNGHIIDMAEFPLFHFFRR